MTGSEFSLIFDNKIDKSYSAFYNTTKKDRLFKEALLSCIEKKYRSMDTQKEYDEISTSIKTGIVYSLNNNVIPTAPIQIALASAIGTAVTITTFLEHNLAAGDSVTVSGISGGVVNINQTATVVSIVSSTVFTYTAAIAPSGVITPNTGYITYSKMISDYLHMLAIKTKFSFELDMVDIESINNASPIIVMLEGQNNLRTGEQIYVSGVSGNTNANGYRYIKKVNRYKVALYSDAKLTTPVSGNSNFFVGGSISRVFYNYATMQISDRKISVFNPPTVDYPSYEMGRNRIKILPLAETCSEITVDYISNNIKLIVSTDTAIDLEQYYPAKFLYYVADEAANLFAQAVKDGELFQSSDFETKSNP